MPGRIVKNQADFFHVRDGETIHSCKARGSFKQQGITPLVGDQVEYHLLSDREEVEGVIDRILPRTNWFRRPAVANVEQFLLVVAGASPKPIPGIMDRILVAAAYQEADVAICVNKRDIMEPEAGRLLKEIYGPWYRMIFVSGRTGEGMGDLRDMLRGRRTAFAGPSGVGKSTLLNALQSAEIAETGEVSPKTERGRHTTRHVELFELTGGGMIYDTPGFTSMDPPEMEADDLDRCYPEMEELRMECRYRDCLHLAEPGCAVRQGMEQGKIHPGRYESYCAQMKELRERERYGREKKR